MTVEFLLPDIGEGLHEAEIVQWFVAEGDTIDRNQPFVEVLTDKANVEMPAPTAGTVQRLGAAVGDIVQVGELLIVIDDGSGGAGDPVETVDAVGADGVGATTDTIPRSTTSAPSPPGPTATSTSPAAGTTGVSGPTRRPKASPATRRLAADLGVDLQTLVATATGPGGRILADDVQAAAGNAPQAHTSSDHPSSDHTSSDQTSSDQTSSDQASPNIGWMAPGVHPLRGVRRATAKAMDRSWSTIPHISASNEIDATALLDARRQLRELQPPGSSNITPLVVALVAIARALRRYPMINASLDLAEET
ncbi:MAG: dihydrolipoamide acetyltransferase family protein, partial [Acidimicrobiales bacterium]